jgi:hypothetical protein
MTTPVPIRIADPVAIAYSEATLAKLAFLDRHDAVRQRAQRIVDRVLPPFPQPNVSTRYPELNGSPAAWGRWEDRCADRSRLLREVRDRIERKAGPYRGAAIEGRPYEMGEG